MVDNSGNLIGGVSGNDFVLTGSATGPGNTSYTGTLLTGEVVAFGSRELGSTDRFQLVFQVTGGTMASLYTGPIGIVITAENSDLQQLIWDELHFNIEVYSRWNSIGRGNY